MGKVSSNYCNENNCVLIKNYTQENMLITLSSCTVMCAHNQTIKRKITINQNVFKKFSA